SVINKQDHNKNWRDHDLKRWRNGEYSNYFKRRTDEAKCIGYYGYGYHGGYGSYHGGDCLCEDNRHD
ncbi:unnamed protein product, partial [Rotaria magnacalcarata]